MIQEKVSIVVPTYNLARFITETLQVLFVTALLFPNGPDYDVSIRFNDNDLNTQSSVE